MRDEEFTSLREADVVVALKDGRQLDGVRVRFEYGFECGRTLFAAWEIDGVHPQ